MLIRNTLKKPYWKSQVNPKDFDLSWNLAVSNLAAERFTVLKITERTQ